jgi:UDP-N-acetylglucosamine:LPS N-acetylglucosamine transferase
MVHVPQAKEHLRSQYSLGQEQRPVVLVTSGSLGISNVYHFVERAFKKRIPIDFVVITGKNTSLYQQMCQIATKGNGGASRLIPFPFVNSMAEWYDTCDYVAGKAGAATCMEVLYHKKPFLCTEWAAQNDRAIVDFLETNSAGCLVSCYKSFINAIIHPQEYNFVETKFENDSILKALYSFLPKE